MAAETGTEDLVRLPEKPGTHIVRPIVQFFQIEATSGGVLLLATALALVAANSPLAAAYAEFWTTPIGMRAGSFNLVLSLRQAVNDGLMTLFFFVVGLEIKRELVMGELRKPRIAAFPIAAAVGGMAVPALLYLSLQSGEAGERGWGIVMATDIAFVAGCLALLGKRVPQNLRIFVLSLAIIDDIGAVLVIALAYTSEIAAIPLWLTVAGVGIVLILQRLEVRSVPVYFVVGVLSWLTIHEAGIHPTILGVLLGLLTPARPWIHRGRFLRITRRVSDFLRKPSPAESEQMEVLRSVAIAAREALSPLQRLETALHPWVNFLILPLFALANAGIALSIAGLSEPIPLAIIVGLALGKPMGILGACLIAVSLGIAMRPSGLRWSVVASSGALCGLGFTMSLFIANLAFAGPMLAQASLGVLAASVISTIVGLGLLLASLRDGGSHA